MNTSLPSLFTEVWIPGAVARELQHQRAPEIVRRWAGILPSWIRVREIADSGFDPDSSEIDRGEWEGIQLAGEIRATLLLIDDRAGVETARAQGFRVTGTLGVLVDATVAELLEIEQALERLSRTKFRHTPDLFVQTVRLVRERERQLPE